MPSPCTKCGLEHTGPCQDAIRAHYEGRIAKLRKHLSWYGKHLYDCDYKRSLAEDREPDPCSCGLYDALTDAYKPDQALKGE